MPMKAARPPKKGSKKDLEAKAAKKDKDAETLSTAVSSLSLESQGREEPEDEGRTATGILVSEARARDIKISAFSLSLHGRVLVEDTIIELNQGGRYGLLGRNGAGKVSSYHQRFSYSQLTSLMM
jgi:ABC-type transport system involved in cytochrome bd biosynthesis fused ATPase/permease subunit